MRRFLAGFATLAALSVPASAHFVYIVPSGAAGGFQVVFNDTPKPDDRVGLELFQKAAFKVVNTSGQTAEAATKSGDDGRPRIDGDAAVVYGTVPYGVMFRGDANPVFVVYHPKAISTAIHAGDTPRPVGQPLELTPVGMGSSVGFLVTENGKPVAGAEVAVYLPGDAKPSVVKTDNFGRTAGFDKPGDYAVRVYRMAPVAGEYQSRKYLGERHYATLTMRYEK